AREIDGPPLSVSSVGAIWLERRAVEEVAAAVRQALCNVVEHARASRASVFAEDEDGWVTITVRDDGIGFDYDEAQLRERNKAGLLRSIKGRVEDLGGTMVVKSSPGSGTEVELCVPRSER
ncbi:MAG: ATP-binding protein, partial [Actinomycetota bacterium]|nr:ATP-binding protein [Actinomycetota bacterium]